MFIEKIKNIVPPPKKIFLPSLLSETEEKISLLLPKDYCELIKIYGAGTFGGFLNILVPYIDTFEYSLLKFMEIDKKNYIACKSVVNSFQLNQNDPRLLDGWKIGNFYNYFPEKNGILPWGKYPEGNEYTFYWKTSGDSWNVVVYDDLYGYKEFDMPMTEFLYNLFIGNII